MKMLKKTLALLLALCVVAALFPPSAVFADDLTNTLTVASGSQTVDGNITVNGKTAAVKSSSSADSQTATEVTGDVSVTYNQTDKNVNGVNAVAENDNSVTDVTIGGDVSATGGKSTNGISTKTDSTGTVNVAVDGDITANGASAYGFYTGHNSSGTSSGTVNAVLGGNIEATGTDGSKETAGVRIYAKNQEQINVTVGSTDEEGTGNITATGSGDKVYGLDISSDSGSVEVVAAGDVTSDGCGILLNQKDNSNNSFDIVVEGTVSGGDNAVQVERIASPDNISLVLWKAELNGGNVVKQDSAAAADVEANILYIIKMEDEAQGAVKLFGVTDSHGYDCAKEDETVTFDSADSSQELVAVFNNDVRLSKDGDGRFFLVVPKGGGVYLRFELAEIVIPDEPSGIVLLLDEDEIDHIGLRLFADKTFVLRLADGTKFFGVYDIADGVIVFTMADGTVVTATVEDSGNQVFALPIGDGASAHFTLKPEKLQKLLSVIG